MTTWLEISLSNDNGQNPEALADALLECGALSVSYESADESELFEPPLGSMPLWSRTRVSGLFEADALDETALLAHLNTFNLPVQRRRFADQAWERVWLQDYRPIDCGAHFWVAPHDFPIDDPQARILRLDPGLAFGTGSHPTTALCLRDLAHRAPRALRVCDYGCGSGILGIAAAMLGAQSVYATDIDPQALLATENNARSNGVTITLCPDPASIPPVDLLLANILLAPLCALRPQFEACITPHSRLLFTGLLDDQQADIEAAYADAFHIFRLDEKEGWILLQLTPRT